MMSQPTWRLQALAVLLPMATGAAGYSADTRPAEAKEQGTSFNSEVPFDVQVREDDGAFIRKANILTGD